MPRSKEEPKFESQREKKRVRFQSPDRMTLIPIPKKGKPSPTLSPPLSAQQLTEKLRKKSERRQPGIVFTQVKDWLAGASETDREALFNLVKREQKSGLQQTFLPPPAASRDRTPLHVHGGRPRPSEIPSSSPNVVRRISTEDILHADQALGGVPLLSPPRPRLKLSERWEPRKKPTNRSLGQAAPNSECSGDVLYKKIVETARTRRGFILLICWKQVILFHGFCSIRCYILLLYV